MNAKFKQIPTKQCRVCGYKAIGFNFDVVTCESCKSFFRRNLYKQETLKCVFSDGNCGIDGETRAFCKRCRLDKCFRVGMKKVCFNRSRKDKNLYQINKMLEIGKIKLFKQLDISLLIPLQELQNAMKVFDIEINEKISTKAENIIQVLNLHAFDLPMTIKFCKSIDAFNCLKGDDQLNILKAFYPAKCALKVAFLYDLELEGWTEFDGHESLGKGVFVKIDIFNQCNHVEFYCLFKSFVISLHVEMDKDSVIRNLLLAQVLFKESNTINENCLEYIRYHHHLYQYILRQYLECKYESTKKADLKYVALMNWMDQLEQVCAGIRHLYRQINPDKLFHVLVEMYL